MRLSLRWRLTLWYGGVLACILAGFSAAVLLMMRQHLLERTDQELDEELSELVLEIRLGGNGPHMLDEVRQHFFHHDVYELQISTPDGRPIFRSQRLLAGQLDVPLIDEGPDSSVRGVQTVAPLGRLRVKSQRVTGPDGPLIAQAAIPLAPNQRELQALLAMLVTVGPLGLLAALAGGLLLARKALSPVDGMTREAEQITAEQLSRRLEVSPRDDELGRLARTLNRMLDRLERCVEQTRRFTADAAHELRTPLAVLRTEIEVCLRAPRSSDNYRQSLQTLLEEIERLSRLADQLLLLCRQDCGLTAPDFEDVPLDALLRDVLDQAGALAAHKGLELQADDFGEWTVVGNDIGLSRLFFNLLDNAIKYTPAGGRITVRGRAAGGEVRITVEDTGIGIAADHLPHIFERFYRADPSRHRQFGGTGLGLAICQAVAHAHHGRLEIDSHPGRGTRAVVILPLAAATVPMATI